MRLLAKWDIPFLVGGGYALAQRLSIVSHTKDFDVFLLPADAPRALRAFQQAGFRAELVFEHWLGKVYHEAYFVDLIFNSGNAHCRVDAGWFEHAAPAVVFGEPARLCPIEETIWQKAFICERERLRRCRCQPPVAGFRPGPGLVPAPGSLRQVLAVLFAHLVLFGFVYPGEEGAVPGWVMDELTRRLREEKPIGRAASVWAPCCRGPST